MRKMNSTAMCWTIEPAIREGVEGRFIVGSTFDRANPVNPQTDFAVSNTYKNLPWGVTLDYTFDDIEMMAYGKIASSYRRGGMNLNDGEPGELFRTELTYDEETSLTYELGLKVVGLIGRLLNAAIFLRSTDFQYDR